MLNFNIIGGVFQSNSVAKAASLKCNNLNQTQKNSYNISKSNDDSFEPISENDFVDSAPSKLNIKDFFNILYGCNDDEETINERNRDKNGNGRTINGRYYDVPEFISKTVNVKKGWGLNMDLDVKEISDESKEITETERENGVVGKEVKTDEYGNQIIIYTYDDNSELTVTYDKNGRLASTSLIEYNSDTTRTKTERRYNKDGSCWEDIHDEFLMDGNWCEYALYKFYNHRFYDEEGNCLSGFDGSGKWQLILDPELRAKYDPNNTNGREYSTGRDELILYPEYSYKIP